MLLWACTNNRHWLIRGRAAGGKDEQVYLCSPETAVASAIMGVITDPRELPKIFKEKGKNIRYPKFDEPSVFQTQSIIYAPIRESEAKDVKLDFVAISRSYLNLILCQIS
jgi:aconitase A